MKKLFAAMILASAAALGGCSSLGGTNTAISSVVTEIEAGVNSVCGYAVQAETVIAILSAGSLTSANAVINLICNAVKPTTVAAARFGARVPVVHVNGKTIIVHGHF